MALVPRILTDPVPAYNFLVGLIDSSTTLRTVVTSVTSFALGGFTDCSGLEGTLQVEPYQAGGENGFEHKFPTRMTWTNITLRKGVTLLGEDLWNWHHDYVVGKGKRRDGFIILQAEAGLLPGVPIVGGLTRLPVKVWRFRRGLPVKWTGPTLNAAQSAVAVEALEIAHEGLELYSAGTGLASGAAALGL
jgi:phage tail-like protein